MTKAKKILNIITIIIILLYFLVGTIGTKVYAVTQTTTDNIKGIDEKKYPGIKEKINSLKSEHPNWEFKILYTGLDWNEVIKNEYVGHGSSPKNLVTSGNSKYGGDWICRICDEKKYDNGNYYCASESAIKYMMDPRNSLNSTDIFQFQELSYSESNESNIQKMLSGSFLDNSTYVNAIISACKKNNVNPYYIVARILQEQGKNGTTLTKGQGYNGQYVGYYNVFNIGASGNGTEKIIINGLARAQKEGWTSLEASINGGINILAKSYIARGQNTLYLQKFDVENSDGSIYWHQYMQNILAAQNEGTTLRKTYNNISAIDSKFTFIIPVYENMPATACNRPSTTKTEEPTTDLVKVNVNSSIRLRNAPNGNKTVGYLYTNEIVTRLEKATSKVNGTYWDKVKKSDGTTGYVARETYETEKEYKLYLIEIKENNTPDTSNNTNNNTGTTDNNNSNGNNDNNNNSSNSNNNSNTIANTSTSKAKIDVQSKIITVIPEATVQDIVELFGRNIIAKDKNGNTLNGNSAIGTEAIVEDMYKVVKLGDVNGDGKVSSSDYIIVKKAIMGSTNLSANYSLGADVNKDGKISSSDYIVIKKYIMGTSKIGL